MRKKANSDFSIVTMRRVAIIFFELGVVKKTHAKMLLARYFMIIFCLKIALDCNSFIYK